MNPELAPAAPLIQQAKTDFEDECRKAGETCDRKYLRVANIAEQLGLVDEHRSMGSFLSKLIHPTGFSICLPGTADIVYQQLYSVGAWYFNDSYERLNDILKSLRLPTLETR